MTNFKAHKEQEKLTIVFFLSAILQKGWIAYSYYTRDPFILASNIPGILVSVWLNLGAAKLQYYERRDGNRRLNGTAEEEDSPSLSDKGSVLAPQELLLLRILALWLLILVSVGWLGIKNANQAAIIGILVNINLLFFYASPLQTVMTVIAEKSSESIHRNTMIMNWVNTSFWVLYGFVARNDPVIYGPNAIGLFFGLLQGLLCCIYPERRVTEVDTQPLLEEGSGPIENEDESTRNVSEVV